MQLIIIMLAKNKHIKIAMTKNNGVIVTDHPNVFSRRLLISLGIEAGAEIIVSIIADELPDSAGVPLEGTTPRAEFLEPGTDVVPLDGDYSHRSINDHDQGGGLQDELLVLLQQGSTILAVVNEFLLHDVSPFWFVEFSFSFFILIWLPT